MTSPIKCPLGSYQELLTCTLCDGFYRDAHTILECMHTFCKSCILVHFHENNTRGSIHCPHCNVNLGLYGHLSSKMIYDRDIQSFVDKLFPQFIAEEKQAEENFYKERNIPLKSESKKHGLSNEGETDAPSKRFKVESGTQERAAASTGDGERAEGEFIAKLVPKQNVEESKRLPPLTKRLCKATKSVRIIKLKNFVHKRLSQEDTTLTEPAQIQLTFKGIVLNGEDRLSVLSSEIDNATDPLEFEYSRC